MRIHQARFSVPFCIFEEPMPSKQLKLLLFLFSESTVEGGCSPGYRAMRHAMRDHDTDKGSDTTVLKYLDALNKAGWIFAIHKTNGRMRIWLKIPARFKPRPKQMELLSVLH